MMDILTYVYEVIKSVPEITNVIEDRIYFYEPSENDDTANPFIIIDPLLSFNAANRSSDSYQTQEYSFQVDVETYDYHQTHNVSAAVIEVLEKHRLLVEGGGMDEYFKDTGRYVISKRFYGTPKILNK